jgi:hypothetical protein
MLDRGLESKIEKENFIDEATIEALEEYPFSSLFQIARRRLIPMSTFDIIWSIPWDVESGTFDGFPTRSYRAKNKHVSS